MSFADESPRWRLGLENTDVGQTPLARAGPPGPVRDHHRTADGGFGPRSRAPPDLARLTSPRASAEVNNRNTRAADPFDERARIRRDEPDVVVWPQGSHPAIEHLNNASAGRDLKHGECTEHVDELAHQAAP